MAGELQTNPRCDQEVNFSFKAAMLFKLSTFDWKHISAKLRERSRKVEKSTGEKETIAVNTQQTILPRREKYWEEEKKVSACPETEADNRRTGKGNNSDKCQRDVPPCLLQRPQELDKEYRYITMRNLSLYFLKSASWMDWLVAPHEDKKRLKRNCSGEM